MSESEPLSGKSAVGWPPASEVHGSKLFLGSKLVWENPPGLGHFGIGIRKQIAELALADMIHQRWMALTPAERERRNRLAAEKFGFDYPEFNSITC